MEDVVKIDRRDGIAILRLNRPTSLNALTQDLARAISNSLIDLDRDDDVNGIVLTGVG
jgi:enoyl-CoA hydratase/carnithine racemase